MCFNVLAYSCCINVSGELEQQINSGNMGGGDNKLTPIFTKELNKKYIKILYSTRYKALQCIRSEMDGLLLTIQYIQRWNDNTPVESVNKRPKSMGRAKDHQAGTEREKSKSWIRTILQERRKLYRGKQ